MKQLSPTQRTAIIFAGLAAAVVPALAACGGSSSSSASSSVSAPSSAPTTSASGSSATGGKPILSNGTAPADRTISVSKTGFSPASLTIQKGQNVTFKANGSGTFAVEVGGLDQATVSGGLIETYVFPEAGVYDVKEVITENTAKITVQ
jgi:plastocyanin